MKKLSDAQVDNIITTMGRLLDIIEELDSNVYYKSDVVAQADDIIKELE